MNSPVRALFRSRWIVIFSFLAAGICSGQAVVCNAASALPLVRAEGLTEYVGDYLLDCTSGTTTVAGFPVPLVNFKFTASTPLSSNPTLDFSEALLIVDEPNSPLNPSRPILNCGAPGAPDNGAGAGICEIISTGDPTHTYDGTANGYGAGAVCDGIGHPAPNTYQCGRPNVFQGRAVAGLNNAVQFVVPFDPPGPSDSGPAHRYFRIINIRVNGSFLHASGGALPLVVGHLSILGGMNGDGSPVTIFNPDLPIAVVTPGLVDPSNGPIESVLTSPILRREGFESAWRARNLSLVVGDNLGTLGNGTFSGGGWHYNGGTQNPGDVAQNVPGTLYNTEEGFTWQNNSPNGSPSPNPPPGFGFLPVSSAGGPLTYAGLGGPDTGISMAGVAQSGTRLAIRFTNIPVGGSVTLPTSVQLTPQGGGTATGVMALTATDTAGAGPYTPRDGTFTHNDYLAVYEVLFADPKILEDVNIPFALAGFPDGTQPHAIISFAPFYSTTESWSANAALPEPRFRATAPQFLALSIFPASGRTGDSINTAITVDPALSEDTAAQLLTGAQVRLVASGQPDIVATPAIVSGRTITATFNLAGAAVGSRDVVVTAGEDTAIPGGFNITAAPPCSYTVGPQSSNYAAAGGSGSLVVSPVPVDCPWSASTSDTWITLGAKQGQLQPYSIAANALTGSRSGTISIAGKNVAITQQGACTYQVSVNPANGTLPAAGGAVTVSIAAPDGCAWSSSVLSTDFMHATSETSGSGNGTVTISVDANAGATRSGSFSVTGSSTQTFTITESANCSSGTDVSTQTMVTRGAILSNFIGSLYTQQIKVTNTSASTLNNVFLALSSLTSQVTSPPAGANACGSLAYQVAPTLAPGQTVTLNFQFAPGKSKGGQPPTYNTRAVTF